MIEGTSKLRLRLLVLAFAPTLIGGTTQPNSLGGFWEMSEGCWLSENSYLNADIEPNIPHYASLTCIDIKDDAVIENEIKFYPASKIANNLAGEMLQVGEGVELQSEFRARAVEPGGGVEVTSIRPAFPAQEQKTITTPINRDTAMVISSRPDDPVDSYRMFITMPTRDLRYIVNLGIEGHDSPETEAGELRGFSIFRQRRIGRDEVENWQNRLRDRFNIGVVVTSTADGQRKLERIDDLPKGN